MDPDAGGGLRARPRARLPPGVLPGARADRSGVRRPAPVPEAHRRLSTRRRPSARARSTRRSSSSTSAPTSPRGNGVWDLGSAEAAELAKLAETTYRDVNIGLANQFARFAEQDGHRRVRGDRGLATPSRTATSTGRASPSAATASRSIPGCTCANDPEATVVRAAREANAAMPEYAVGLLAEAYGDLTDARVVVLGAAYRGGVKETAFSGVFATVAALRRARRRPARRTTRCTPTRSCRRSASRLPARGAGRRRDPAGRPRRVPRAHRRRPARRPGVRQRSRHLPGAHEHLAAGPHHRRATHGRDRPGLITKKGESADHPADGGLPGCPTAPWRRSRRH